MTPRSPGADKLPQPAQKKPSRSRWCGGWTPRNIRLESTNTLLVNIPKEGWARFKVLFSKRYMSLIEELVELAKSKKTSYSARVVFRDSRTYLHLSVPLELYLRHFKKGARGELIAGFDLNSDRVNYGHS